MARKKIEPDKQRARRAFAERLKEIRVELCGQHGGAEFARLLGLPPRTWYNYEMGIAVPAEVILRFIEQTSVEPAWLLHGQGSKYRTHTVGPTSDRAIDQVARSLKEVLQHVSEGLERGRLCINVNWEKSK
jgi:hypothetical protein